MWLQVKSSRSRLLKSPFVSSCPPSLLFLFLHSMLPALYVALELLKESSPNVFHISSEPSLFPNSCRVGFYGERRPQQRGEKRGREADGRQAGSATQNSTVKVVSTERGKSLKTRGKMRQGQKGSSDMEGKKKRDESPAPTDGHKCRFFRFPLLVATLQLLLGVAVTAVAFLMMAISPSLLARETPHWAGIILCLVAIVGFVLYFLHYLPDERSSMQFFVKLLYFVLCAIGLVISVLVMAFAGHHYSQANSFTCEQVGEDCECKLEPEDPIARTFTYEGVSDCEVINGTLTLYFLLQIVLNLVQALVCAVGAFILWKDRYQVFFAGLQIGSPSFQQWQKV